MHAELLDPVEDGPEAAPREVRELGDVDRHLEVALARVQRARPADEVRVRVAIRVRVRVRAWVRVRVGIRVRYRVSDLRMSAGLPLKRLMCDGSPSSSRFSSIAMIWSGSG